MANGAMASSFSTASREPCVGFGVFAERATRVTAGARARRSPRWAVSAARPFGVKPPPRRGGEVGGLESAKDGRPPRRRRSPRARGGHLGEQVVSGSRHGLAKRRGSDTGGASPEPRASRAPGGPRGRQLETDRGCGRGEERRVRLGTLAVGDRQGGRRGPDLDRARGASIIIIVTTRNAPFYAERVDRDCFFTRGSSASRPLFSVGSLTFIQPLPSRSLC